MIGVRTWFQDRLENHRELSLVFWSTNFQHGLQNPVKDHVEFKSSNSLSSQYGLASPSAGSLEFQLDFFKMGFKIRLKDDLEFKLSFKMGFKIIVKDHWVFDELRFNMGFNILSRT